MTSDATTDRSAPGGSATDSPATDSPATDSSSADNLAPPHWGQPRSRTVTWYDPMATAAAGTTMSGFEFLQAIRDGTLPPAPIASLFLMRGVEAENGRVVFECEPDQSAYNPIGVVHGGLVCTLADTVAGCAVHSTLEAGVGYTSIDINVSYLRPGHQREQCPPRHPVW